MKKDEMEQLITDLECDRRRADPCPWMGWVLVGAAAALLLLTTAALYAVTEKMCYNCGSFYTPSRDYPNCPACYPPLEND